MGCCLSACATRWTPRAGARGARAARAPPRTRRENLAEATAGPPAPPAGSVSPPVLGQRGVDRVLYRSSQRDAHAACHAHIRFPPGTNSPSIQRLIRRACRRRRSRHRPTEPPPPPPSSPDPKTPSDPSAPSAGSPAPKARRRSQGAPPPPAAPRGSQFRRRCRPAARSLPHFVGANTLPGPARVAQRGGADLGGGATLATPATPVKNRAREKAPAASAATRLAGLRWSRLWLVQPPRGTCLPGRSAEPPAPRAGSRARGSRSGTVRRARGGTRVAAISRRRKRVLTRIRGFPYPRSTTAGFFGKGTAARLGDARAVARGFRAHVPCFLPYPPRARTSPRSGRLSVICSGARRLPRRARPTGISVSNPARARERAVT